MTRKLHGLRLFVVTSSILFFVFGLYFIGKALSLIPGLTKVMEINPASTMHLWALGLIVIITPPALVVIAIIIFVILATTFEYIYGNGKDKVKEK